MNAQNYGYPQQSSYLPPNSSTPRSAGPQRPRFGYPGPAHYPRPRSSASKPNPGPYSNTPPSNNYGNASYNSDFSGAYDNSYYSDSSVYYSANESYYPGESYEASPQVSMGNNYRDNSMWYPEESGAKPAFASTPKHFPNYKPFKRGASHAMNNRGGSQKNSFQRKNQANSFNPFGPRPMATFKGNLRCGICSLDFSSQIPYDMHMKGAKHARKVKSLQASTMIQCQSGVNPEDEKTFFCSLCNVHANSAFQFKTHLDGSKHKNKITAQASKEEAQTADGLEVKADAKSEVADSAAAAAPTTPAVSDPTSSPPPPPPPYPPPSSSTKTNGSVVRPAPADFGYPQPSKLPKFSCDICNVTVNSDQQLQQHLTSKKHQAKVEGKPLIRGRKRPAFKNAGKPSNEPTQKVVGVTTLESSFVKGETMQ